MSNNTNPNPHHVDSAPAPLDLAQFEQFLGLGMGLNQQNAVALLAELRAARAETERLRSLVKSLSTELAVAVAYCGHELSGPTDHRAAEDGEPHWVCNARAALAESRGAAQ